MIYIFFIGLLIGSIIGTIVGQQRKIIKNQEQQIKALTIERAAQVRLATLESTILRNEFDIEVLQKSDEQKRLMISQMHGWFGSMIRHSAEEPFKKEAIEKFLAEEELKNTN